MEALLLKQEHATYYLKDGITDEIVYGGAAGGGKSALGCLWLIENCQQYAGSRWLMGRTVFAALISSTFATFMNLINEWGIKVEVNMQTKTIRFPNGSIILMKDLEYKPSDPNFDNLGGLEICGAFIDEAAQLSETAYNVIKSRIRYKLDEFQIEPKLLMTCNPTKNFIFNLFYKPTKNNNIISWRKFIQSKYSDNKYLPQDYITNLSRLSPDLRARLMDGDWEFNEEQGQLIKYEHIFNMVTDIIPQTGDYFLTIDVARFGKDSTVMYIWKGFTIVDILILNKNDLNTQINHAKDFVLKYKIANSRVIVDSDGVGAGVTDVLRARGIVNNAKAVNGENFQNLKTQLYFKLSERIDEIKILNKIWDMKIDNSTFGEMLTQELLYVRRENIDADGKLSLMSKDKIKSFIGRSPDFADALAYRMLNEISRPLTVMKTKR